MGHLYKLLMISILIIGPNITYAEEASSSYSGTFQAIYDPFAKKQINFYKTGKYIDQYGITWEGEFDFIPLNDSVKHWGAERIYHGHGSIIFFGAKIDPQLDEVVRGLYIDEKTSPDAPLYFVKARPDYLEKIRDIFVANSNQTAEDRAAEARASRELFTSIVAIASGAAVIYSANRMAARSDRTTLDSLTNVVKGQKSAVVANTELGQTRKNPNGGTAYPLTVAEYKAQQTSGSTSTSNTKPKVSNESRRSNMPTSTSSSLSSEERSSPKTVEDVVESNPHEQFSSSPNSWGHPINGWLASHKWGATRESACAAAIDAQNKSISNDESKGYVTVSERTDCICGSYSRKGVTTFAQPQWACGAYYKLQNTGKNRGTISR